MLIYCVNGFFDKKDICSHNIFLFSAREQRIKKVLGEMRSFGAPPRTVFIITFIFPLSSAPLLTAAVIAVNPVYNGV